LQISPGAAVCCSSRGAASAGWSTASTAAIVSSRSLGARKDIGLNEKDQKRLRDHLDLAARELSAAKATRHKLLLTQDVIDAVHDTLHIVSDSSKTLRQGACRMASW
jgi:hypothetical protein